MNILRKYWARLRVTPQDNERGYRSFWLQFAATRFQDVKTAAELVRIAHQFNEWHQDGTHQAEATAGGPVEVSKWRREAGE